MLPCDDGILTTETYKFSHLGSRYSEDEKCTESSNPGRVAGGLQVEWLSTSKNTTLQGYDDLTQKRHNRLTLQKVMSAIVLCTH